MKAMLSIKETADLLDVSETTVRRMIHKGQLKAVKIGALYKIPISELRNLGVPQETIDLWLASQEGKELS